MASSTHYINIKLNEQTHQASNLQGIFKVQTFGQAQCESPLAAGLAHSAEQVRCESPLVTAIHCRLSKPRARCPSPLSRSKGRVRPMRVVNRSSHPPAAEHARCELPLNAVVVKPLSTLKARRHLLLPTIHGWTPRCEYPLCQRLSTPEASCYSRCSRPVRAGIAHSGLRPIHAEQSQCGLPFTSAAISASSLRVAASGSTRSASIASSRPGAGGPC